MKFGNAGSPPGSGTPVECPVCRMEVDPVTAPASMEFRGGRYSFCAFRCRDRFQERPESFLAGRRTPSVSPIALGGGSCCG